MSDAVRAAQVAEVRVLARAGRLAEKQTAHTDARTRAHDMAMRSIAAELAGVLRSTDRALQRRIGEARELVECYPAVLTAWESGIITRGHVAVIVQCGGVVPLDLRPEFELAAIDACRRDARGRARAVIEMIALRMHPRSFTVRHAEASAGRCVRVIAGPDGMSDLIATLPTILADTLLAGGRTYREDAPTPVVWFAPADQTNITPATSAPTLEPAPF